MNDGPAPPTAYGSPPNLTALPRCSSCSRRRPEPRTPTFPSCAGRARGVRRRTAAYDSTSSRSTGWSSGAAAPEPRYPHFRPSPVRLGGRGWMAAAPPQPNRPHPRRASRAARLKGSLRLRARAVGRPVRMRRSGLRTAHAAAWRARTGVRTGRPSPGRVSSTRRRARSRAVRWLARGRRGALWTKTCGGRKDAWDEQSRRQTRTPLARTEPAYHRRPRPRPPAQPPGQHSNLLPPVAPVLDPRSAPRPLAAGRCRRLPLCCAMPREAERAWRSSARVAGRVVAG